MRRGRRPFTLCPRCGVGFTAPRRSCPFCSPPEDALTPTTLATPVSTADLSAPGNGMLRCPIRDGRQPRGQLDCAICLARLFSADPRPQLLDRAAEVPSEDELRLRLEARPLLDSAVRHYLAPRGETHSFFLVPFIWEARTGCLDPHLWTAGIVLVLGSRVVAVMVRTLMQSAPARDQMAALERTWQHRDGGMPYMDAQAQERIVRPVWPTIQSVVGRLYLGGLHPDTPPCMAPIHPPATGPGAGLACCPGAGRCPVGRPPATTWPHAASDGSHSCRSVARGSGAW